MKVEIEITQQQIADLLTDALEGGHNYWYEIKKQNPPTQFTFRIDKDRVYEHIDFPMNPGGYLVIKQTVDESGPGARRLTLQRLEAGMRDLAASEKYRHHFVDILKEDTDGTTADVFLQFALYGDVLFG